MKFDYSKTINEQLDIFNYYKNRYANYELSILKLQQENKELKQQLEEYIRAEMRLKAELEKQRKEYQEDYKDIRIEIKEYKSQQKEFIDWLENEIKGCHNYSKYIENKLQELKSRSAGKTYIANEIMKNEVAKKCFTKILSKYKEIIGKDINVATKKDVK